MSSTMIPSQPPRNAADTAVKNRDEIFVASFRITTGASNLLTTLGASFATDLTSIMLIPEDSTIATYMDEDDPASATDAKIPAFGVHLPMNKTVADAIQVFSAGSFMTLYTFGPRN